MHVHRPTAALCLVLTLASCAPVPNSRAGHGEGHNRQVPTADASGHHPSSQAAPAPEGAAADPVRLRIPAIGVKATIEPVGLNRANALQPPRSYTEAGWWRGGPAPGEAGPATLVGHLDTPDGPAVFAGLRELRPGDTVTVRRSGGSAVTFDVRAVEQHPQDAFPSKKVYGPTQDAQLRLITCGGAFDKKTGRYRDNTIVFASLRSRQR